MPDTQPITKVAKSKLGDSYSVTITASTDNYEDDLKFARDMLARATSPREKAAAKKHILEILKKQKQSVTAANDGLISWERIFLEGLLNLMNDTIPGSVRKSSLLSKRMEEIFSGLFGLAAKEKPVNPGTDMRKKAETLHTALTSWQQSFLEALVDLVEETVPGGLRSVAKKGVRFRMNKIMDMAAMYMKPTGKGSRSMFASNGSDGVDAETVEGEDDAPKMRRVPWVSEKLKKERQPQKPGQKKRVPWVSKNKPANHTAEDDVDTDIDVDAGSNWTSRPKKSKKSMPSSMISKQEMRKRPLKSEKMKKKSTRTAEDDVDADIDVENVEAGSDSVRPSKWTSMGKKKGNQKTNDKKKSGKPRMGPKWTNRATKGRKKTTIGSASTENGLKLQEILASVKVVAFVGWQKELLERFMDLVDQTVPGGQTNAPRIWWRLNEVMDLVFKLKPSKMKRASADESKYVYNATTIRQAALIVALTSWQQEFMENLVDLLEEVAGKDWLKKENKIEEVFDMAFRMVAEKDVYVHTPGGVFVPWTEIEAALKQVSENGNTSWMKPESLSAAVDILEKKHRGLRKCYLRMDSNQELFWDYDSGVGDINKMNGGGWLCFPDGRIQGAVNGKVVS